MLLSRCPGVISLAVCIETSFVADAYRVGVVTSGVGSWHLLRTALMEQAVPGDVIVIADTLKPASTMAGFESFQGEVLSDLRSRTVDDYKIDSTHG